jgi:hypothetical protein
MRSNLSAWIANKVTFLEDINALTTVKFLSDAHFNKVVGATIAKVYEMGYPEDRVADKSQLIYSITASISSRPESVLIWIRSPIMIMHSKITIISPLALRYYDEGRC